MIKTNLFNKSDLLINSDSINDLVKLILTNYKYTSANINIIITDDDTLRKMKKKYFNKNIFTDVIAFNIDNNPFEGEVYISYHRIKDNAIKFNQSFEDEFKRVLIHGLLHLCGYEDSTNEEKINMSSMEDKFLEEFHESVMKI